MKFEETKAIIDEYFATTDPKEIIDYLKKKGFEPIKPKEYRLSIEHDYFLDNPRTWDNLGTLVTKDLDESKGNVDFDKCIQLPVYKYKHGSVAYSTKPFSCKWDSGQVGIVYVEKERIRKEYGVKNVTESVLKTVRRVLEAELETYSQWCNGESYFWIIFDETGDQVDSCGGYYNVEDAEKDGQEQLNNLKNN